MKVKLSLVLLCAMLLSLFLPCVGVYANGALVDQESVIGSYCDGAQSLPQLDRGFSANGCWMYAGPGKTDIKNPTSYSFLNICLMHYSASHPDGVNYGKSDIPLDESFFDTLRQTLSNARYNGVSVGIRFEYDTNGKTQMEPEWDMLVHHFSQIKESGILDEYADNIIWCELGTIGAFGEQWGSKYGNNAYSTELIDIYLGLFRSDIPILLRTTGRITTWVNDKLGTSYTANSIQNMVGDANTLYADRINNTSDYFSGDGKNFSTGNLIKDDLSRLGLYNDGYMGTLIDYGTFGNRANETSFLNQQTNVVYGGEYSGDRYLQIADGDGNPVWYPINAIPEMYYTHLSYLHGGPWGEGPEQNYDFATEAQANDFIAEYRTVCERIGRDIGELTLSAPELQSNGKYRVRYTALGYNTLPFTAQIEQAVEEKIGVELDLSEYYGVNTRQFILDHLSYRFVLRSSKMTGGSMLPGDTLAFELAIENTGFHKIIKQKEVELLLVNGAGSYSMELSDVDVREWDTGTHTFTGQITLPEHISGGDWQVYLRVSTPNEKSEDDAKWCVQFANDGIYNTALGANLIGQITVNAPEHEMSEFIDTRVTGVYYDTPVTHPADEEYLDFTEGHPYIFKQDGLFGFSVLFKVEGTQGSEISLSRWETNGSGSQLHAFNWFFHHDPVNDENGKQIWQYGARLTGDGYYIMYNPFPSVALNSTVQNISVAGQTMIQYFYVNATRTPREDKNSPTQLGGKDVTITPLGIVEGAATGYNVTFHYNGAKNYTGTYGFQNTDRPVTENCQFKLSKTVLELYDGATPANYTAQDGLAYRFVGWTTQPGYRQGLVSADQIAIGTLDLYPYYEVDLSASALGAHTAVLTDGKDENGIVYTLDPETMQAAVGTGSAWAGNSGFNSGTGDTCVIPAYVISDGVMYEVTGIAANAFSGCNKLKAIVIPSNVTEIAPNAFAGILGQVCVRAQTGSAAAEYAQAGGATLEQTVEQSVYSVVFKNGNQILSAQSVTPGTIPVYDGPAPERAGDSDFCSYTFDGWEPQIGAVSADTVYQACFTGTPHEPGEAEYDGELSCLTPTDYSIRCIHCDMVIGQGSEVALEHTYGAGVVTTPPTSAAEGIMTYTCTRCGGASYTESIPCLTMDGDIDGDGVLTRQDAQYIAEYIAQGGRSGSHDLSAFAEESFDVNGDGKVDLFDLNIVLQAAKGK